MHLIISDKFDQPTNIALRWFSYYGKDVEVINFNESIFIDFSIGFDTPKIIFNNTIIKISDIKSIWFRRGKLKLN